MPVVLIGTLDTKGIEFQFVRDLLTAAGVRTLVMDAGVLQPPAFTPDIPRELVYAAAGTSLAAIQRANNRGQAIEAAAKGAAKILVDLLAKGQVDGVLSLGGSAGTTIGTAAMRALPVGIPKLMVSTLASGQVKHWVGVRDILMLHSVVDISGLNRISRAVLANAAHAMAGMVQGSEVKGQKSELVKFSSFPRREEMSGGYREWPGLVFPSGHRGRFGSESGAGAPLPSRRLCRGLFAPLALPIPSGFPARRAGSQPA